MTFKEAAEFKLPFGKHKGSSLDKVATDDDGLRYLAWLRGVREEEGQSYPLDRALSAYLDDPAIKKDLGN